MSEAEMIIHEYREAFHKYAKDGIIDMDNRLRHKFNVQIRRLEDYVAAIDGVMPPNRESLFYIVLVKKGGGEKKIGKFTFPIQDNLVYIIPKRVVHSGTYLYKIMDFCGYSISFSCDFFLQQEFPRQHIVNKKIFKKDVKPYLLLTDSQMGQLEVIFKFLLDEYNEHDRCKDEMIAIKILELLIQCNRIICNAETETDMDPYSDLVEKFNELIEKNHREERSVRFYADALHVHPNHLNFVVKKYAGMTAKETIVEYILIEAKYMLRTSTLTIKEISYKLGFDDPNYFSSFFGGSMGMSPVRYRQEFI